MVANEELPVGERILRHLDDLTPAERRVAHALLGNFPTLALRSATVIAAESHTSPATVVRFASKLGYEGLPGLHAAVREGLQGSAESPFALYEVPSADGKPAVTAAQSLLSLVTDALHRLKPTQIRETVDLIQSSRRVWVAGGRFSHGIAYMLYAHLNILRPDVRLLAPLPLAVADQIAHAGRDDLVIVADFRRYDPAAEFIAAHFSSSRGRVVVVTDPFLSPAAQHANITFVVPVEGVGLVDSYAGAMAVMDLLIADLIAADEQSMTRGLAAIERAREHAQQVQVKSAGGHLGQ